MLKKALLCVAVGVLPATAIAQTVYVRPHVRSDGTYVPGHHRTAPNSTKTDNWSSKPNTNPYNGRQGSIDPYKAPQMPQQRRSQTARSQQSYSNGWSW